MAEYYRQCEFKSGASKTVAWIEERGAKVGASVSFKEDPERRWEVVKVGEKRITKQQAKNLERRNVAFQRSLG